MTKDIAVVVSDGSIESAVLCAIARQTYDLVLLDAAPSESGRREAVRQQVNAVTARDVESAETTLDAPADDADMMFALTALLPQAGILARQHGAAAIYLPLRTGVESSLLGQAAEWAQLAEELLRHGLGLVNVSVQVPLLELEPWQLVDLAGQIDAPLHASHGQEHHVAFVKAGRGKP